MQHALETGFKKAVEFSIKHPTTTKVMASIGVAIGTKLVSELTKNQPSNSEYERLDDDYNEYEATTNEKCSVDKDNSQSIDRSSPDEHSVRSHGQHYNTKEGRIWKEKDSYSRGGKKGE